LLFSTDHLEELVKWLLSIGLPVRLRELVVTAQDVTLCQRRRNFGSSNFLVKPT
jgi:hypothetical protein